MKKDDKQPNENHTNSTYDLYFDAIQVGDIRALNRIEDTVEDPKLLLIHPTRRLHKSGTAMAAYHGQNHIIKHFIDKFDIGLNPMVMIAAVMGGQIETMLYLNQKVPEKQRIAFNVRSQEVIFNGVKYNDLTLMHVAAFFGQTRIMILLHKDSKVPPSQHIPYNVKTCLGVTPMHMAAAAEQINTMIFLRKDWRIPADECTPYNIKDRRGISPLQFAVSSGRITTTIFLNSDRRVSEHTPFDDKSYSGCTLMHAAAGCGQLRVMKFLANQGLRYDAKSDEGYTPMHTAASGGHLETMIYLNEDIGVTPGQRTPYDVKTEGGITPLDRAIAGRHIHVVHFLNKVLKSSSSNESTNVNPPFRNLQQNTINETGRNVLTPQPPQAFGGPNPNVPLQNNTLIVSPPKVSSPYDEILRRLGEQEKKMNELLNQQKSPQNCSNQSEMKKKSRPTKNRNNNPKSSMETNSNNKRSVARDKAKPKSARSRKNKRLKTASITAGTVEALKSRGFLAQERNRPLDQEIIYVGDYPHPLGGQSLDNLARLAKIKTEHPDEENEVDSVMKY